MKERLGKVKMDFWFLTKFFVIAAMCLFIVYPFYTILTKSVFSNKVEGLTLYNFVRFFILEHTQIGLISRWSNLTAFKGSKHCATRLMCMGAVAIFTILRELEELYKVMRNLFNFHIKGSKALYSRSVYDVAAGHKLEHLGICRGVHSRIVSL